MGSAFVDFAMKYQYICWPQQKNIVAAAAERPLRRQAVAGIV